MNKIEKLRFIHGQEMEGKERDALEMLCLKIEQLSEGIAYHSNAKKEALDGYLEDNSPSSFKKYLLALKYEDSARRELAELQAEYERVLGEKQADYPPQIVSFCYLTDLSGLPEEMQDMIRQAKHDLGIAVGEEIKTNGSKPTQLGEE